MRKMVLFSLLVVLSLGAAQAMGGELEDVVIHPECPYCGMDRAKFAHSRILLTYDDQSTLGLLLDSLRRPVDMVLYLDRSPIAISVGDAKHPQTDRCRKGLLGHGRATNRG